MSDYGLTSLSEETRIPAPELDYRPPRPQHYSPKIGLIGCGGITASHLNAYREMGLEVAAFCDRDETRARERRDAYNPAGDVFTDFKDVLARDDIEVIDAATHPEVRGDIVEAALLAQKHVLSQKPFVTDVNAGRALCDLADAQGVELAVNQNARWAPHFAWMRQAINADLLGAVSSLDFSMQFDHSWTEGTSFEDIHHLVLYDFAIHWFDMARVFMGDRVINSVYASVQRAPYQKARPPFLAQVVADLDDAQIRMSFNANTRVGTEDRTIICGEKGTLRSIGPILNKQSVHMWTEQGYASPELSGDWFAQGFQGTMGELLCAIEDKRIPFNNARDNLASLEFCFAALKSADTGLPVCPGTVQEL